MNDDDDDDDDDEWKNYDDDDADVRMERKERMCALGCMFRAMVMYELARGSGVPGALSEAGAQNATAAILKRVAAARAPAFHPCHPFPFSGRPEHAAPNAAFSNNNLSVSRTTCLDTTWARSERGVAAGCGVVRWAVQLGHQREYVDYKVGVASDAFREYTSGGPKQSWFFTETYIFADGQLQGGYLDNPPFCRATS